MPSDLASRECAPCRGKVPPLPMDRAEALRRELGGDWQVIGNRHLEKTYAFRDFAEALAFTNRVGAVAETQQHHPDIHLAWGKVGVTVWTHRIDGLTESDFILAAKCEAVR